MKSLFALGAGVLLLSAACIRTGGRVAEEEITSPVVKIPSQILGLRLQQEDVSEQVKQVGRRYVDSVGMFSLRENDLLRATFQVSRLNSLARPGSEDFRRQVIGLLGASKPQEIKVGDVIVYSTSGNQQNVFVWFRGRGLYVLSVHQDYTFPRTLLRKCVNLKIDL